MRFGKDFVVALKQIEEEKGLPAELIVSSLEAAIGAAYKKYKNGDPELEAKVEIGEESCEITLTERYLIVETVERHDREWTKEEAAANGFPDLNVDDVACVDVSPESFGRIAAQTARQVIIQRLKDAERQIVFSEFANHIGDLVVGTIFKSEGDLILVSVSDKTDAMLPKEERINRETYNLGERKKFLILEVRQTTRGPKIIVSRTHPNLLKRLLEVEVPEINDGVVSVRGIVREAGTRAKIAVSSLDANVDPVGACIGNSGARIKSISDDLSGERIDVITWSGDPLQYVRNALSPAKAIKIEPVIDQEKTYRVYVRPDQLSLAIGKAGQNVRLAARLTGWKIDIKVTEPDRLPTMKDLFEDEGIKVKDIIDELGASLWEDDPK
ncbi:transcription termination/antitermination protein NusA [Synergistales bacterium]|nr:transcription termination/antitermination protein NusA [Synergistales bacterium]